MRAATLLPVLLLAACAPQRPPVVAPLVENPREIAAGDWHRTGATSIAHLRALDDGIVVAWVKVEPPVRRVVSTGEPNFAPVQRQMFAWVEADCRGSRVRQSHQQEYADGQAVRENPLRKSVGWRTATGESAGVFALMCDEATVRASAIGPVRSPA